MIEFDEEQSIVDLAREQAQDELRAEHYVRMVRVEKEKLLRARGAWRFRLAAWLMRPRNT